MIITLYYLTVLICHTINPRSNTVHKSQHSIYTALHLRVRPLSIIIVAAHKYSFSTIKVSGVWHKPIPHSTKTKCVPGLVALLHRRHLIAIPKVRRTK